MAILHTQISDQDMELTSSYINAYKLKTNGLAKFYQFMNDEKFDQAIFIVFSKDEFHKLLSSCHITTSEPVSKIDYHSNFSENVEDVVYGIFSKAEIPTGFSIDEIEKVTIKYLGEDVGIDGANFIAPNASKEVVSTFNNLFQSAASNIHQSDEAYDNLSNDAFKSWVNDHLSITEHDGNLVDVQWIDFPAI